MNVQIKFADAGYPLITRERTEKLELLAHLVDNLAHAIIICGPEGVGKTRLLKCFKETTKEPWLFCWLEGNSQLKLEKVLEMLNESIVEAMPELKALSLANALEKISASNNQVILVVDDTGNLAPGLINQLIAFAERKPMLRLILALTHSEIYLKNGTDPAIDECYQIDIPPLSEQQCGDFLEYLSTLPKPRIQFSAINESMVAALYSETHGIPGKILTQLPADDSGEKKDYSKLILISSVVGLILIALGVQWWSGRPKTEETQTVVAENSDLTAKTVPQEPASAVVTARAVTQESAPKPEVSQPDAAVATTTPAPVRNDIVTPQNSASTSPNATAGEPGTQIPQPVQPSETLSEPPVVNQVQVTSETSTTEQPQPVSVVPEDEGGRWLMAQPAENYTFQLMALSDEQAIIQVMQKHQALGQNLKYLKTKTRKGRDRFVLVYGSFSSPDQTKNEAALLPKELQKYWLRQIGAIQNEIGSTTVTDVPG